MIKLLTEAVSTTDTAWNDFIKTFWEEFNDQINKEGIQSALITAGKSQYATLAELKGIEIANGFVDQLEAYVKKLYNDINPSTFDFDAVKVLDKTIL